MGISQPDGEEWGGLVGDVEAEACRIGRRVGINEGGDNIIVDRVDGSPPKPYVPSLALK